MRNSFTAVTLLVAGIMLGQVQAQQASATKPATATAAKTSTAARPHTATAAKAPLVLSTQKAKLSYALGMNIGQGVKSQPVDIDPDVLTRGIKDAMTGAKPLLTEDEAKAVLTQTTERVAPEATSQDATGI